MCGVSIRGKGSEKLEYFDSRKKAQDVRWGEVDDTTNNLVEYSTWYGMIHQKRGGTLHGLQNKREREEYVGVF